MSNNPANERQHQAVGQQRFQTRQPSGPEDAKMIESSFRNRIEEIRAIESTILQLTAQVFEVKLNAKLPQSSSQNSVDEAAVRQQIFNDKQVELQLAKYFVQLENQKHSLLDWISELQKKALASQEQHQRLLDGLTTVQRQQIEGTTPQMLTMLSAYGQQTRSLH